MGDSLKPVSLTVRGVVGGIKVPTPHAPLIVNSIDLIDSYVPFNRPHIAMHSVTVMKAVAAAGKQVWEDQPRTIEDVCSIVEGAGFTIKVEHHPYVQGGDVADGVNIGDGDCLGPVWMQTIDGPDRKSVV